MAATYTSSNVEALTRLIPLAVPRDASPDPPRTFDAISSPASTRAVMARSIDADSETWLRRWSMALVNLDKAILAEVDRRLAIGDKGQQLSPWTAGRNRKVARACIRRAVDLDVLEADPWPAAPKGRSRRKAVRRAKSVEIRRLPDPTTMARAIAAIPSHQPASRMYQVMIAVAYYAVFDLGHLLDLERCASQPPDGDRIEVSRQTST